MENLEMFIGKKVLITVAFYTPIFHGGSGPHKFIGILEKINGDFLELSDVKIENLTGSSYYNYSNSAIINKQYLIMMSEA